MSRGVRIAGVFVGHRTVERSSHGAGGPQPAGGDPGRTVPEAWPARIIARPADRNGGRVAEPH